MYEIRETSSYFIAELNSKDFNLRGGDKFQDSAFMILAEYYGVFRNPKNIVIM
jgi:hypothetical protein